MGILDTVTNALGGGGAGDHPLVNAVMQMVTNQSGGGLQGLLDALESGGLKEQVASWISTGHNLPVSADQIQNALGGGHLGQIAAEAGVSESEAAKDLAHMLPQIVDRLTPNGQVPAGDLLSQGLNLLKGKLFG